MRSQGYKVKDTEALGRSEIRGALSPLGNGWVGLGEGILG